MIDLKDKVNKKAIHSSEKSDEHGEVFTPVELIEQMCDSLPKDFWLDENKTWLDPCSGKGNMPAVIVGRLMESLKDKIKDDRNRYRHIMERMIYMCEFQEESCRTIEDIFNPNGDVKLNLYFGDTLKMPEDFFDLSYEERRNKYSANCITPTPVVTDTEIKVTEEKKIDPWMANILKMAKTVPKPIEEKRQAPKVDMSKYLDIARRSRK